MSARFDLIDTPLAGLKIVQRHPRGDARGLLERIYCSEELDGPFGGTVVAQVNRSMTCGRGAVRGMHFQSPPHAETKLVSCFSGEIFDVAIDLRDTSPTRHQWFGAILSEDNHQSLLIPPGFAHGFQLLSDVCQMLYLHTAPYVAASESAVNACDPILAIDWPLPITLMSDRDRGHPWLDTVAIGMRS